MSSPKITLICAMTAKTQAIGINNTLPWYLPADLQYFKAQTLGKPVLMGRKTYESIGKPLANRLNIVLSQNNGLEIAGCELVHSIKQAIAVAKNHKELMVIGGASIYKQTIDIADKLVLTFVEADIEADEFFPKFDLKIWREVSSKAYLSDEKNPYNYRFVTFLRR